MVAVDRWEASMRKLFWIGIKDRGQNKSTKILMEIVSAQGLVLPELAGSSWSIGSATSNENSSSQEETTTTSPVDDLNRVATEDEVDANCRVKFGSAKVHQTATIWKDSNPIWTIKTGSICLLSIPPDWKKALGSDEVTVEVFHGMTKPIGVVKVPIQEVLKKEGEREEFDIFDDMGKSRGVLALRFRLASSKDIQFLADVGKVTFNSAGKATDINFKRVRGNNNFIKTKTVRNQAGENVTMYRAQPIPDPDRVEETTWFSKEDLHAEALKPSTKWVEAGFGEMGTAYVEVIGCNDLVDLDSGVVGDHTDSYIGIVFEDTMVRTGICFDNLNPRWMPWSSRAFAFHICHPSSPLFVGVMDYDVMDSHDPVGRIVINTTKFRSGVSYLLHYRLDHRGEQDRGTLILRIRVEWRDEKEMIQKTFTEVPRFLINVDNSNSLAVLRYICRGAVDMNHVSMETVKLYARELVSYVSVYCYMIDICIGIWLWRGRAQFKLFGRDFDIWFPIHSIFIFVSSALAIEKPHLIPGLFLYAIGWLLISMNFYWSHHPNPWQRCQSVPDILSTRWFGMDTGISGPHQIDQNEGYEEAQKLEKIEALRAERVQAFFIDVIRVGLKIRRIYRKTDIANIPIDTKEEKWSFLGKYLYYVHLLLYYWVTYLNMIRNFFNWHSYSAHAMAMQCITLGSLLIFLPTHMLQVWTLRLFVWVWLGPLMKVVDMWLIHPHYRTAEELKEDPHFHGTGLSSLLQSDNLKVLGRKVRWAAEESFKLKDMREYRFGKYCWQVPTTKISSNQFVPLPESTATPYLGCEGNPDEGFVDVPEDRQKWSYVPGQKLEGTMIHRQKTARYKNRGSGWGKLRNARIFGAFGNFGSQRNLETGATTTTTTER